MLSSAFIDFSSYIVLFAATTCVFMLSNNLNSADLFTLKLKHRMVQLDQHCNYIEVSPSVKDTTSTAVIKFMEQQFNRHGIPNELVTNNGPQFVSKEFKEFTCT